MAPNSLMRMKRSPNGKMRHAVALGAFWAAFCVLATQSALGQEAMMLPQDPAPLLAETSSGSHRFSIEVADEPQKWSRGLMFRQTMDDDHGMLFVFRTSGRLGFWMKNTPMPLDLLFIGEDGKVRAIERGIPFSTISISPPVSDRFVLELKAGAARAAGIEIGARLHHPFIDAVAGEK